MLAVCRRCSALALRSHGMALTNASSVAENCSQDILQLVEKRFLPSNCAQSLGVLDRSGLRGSDIHHPLISRTVFSLPGFEDDTAKRYTERRLIGYSPQQMYDVVSDVDQYSEFVPWCQKSRILRRSSSSVLEAELEVGFQIFVEKYTSKVTLKPPRMVRSQVESSTLFSHLDSTWKFDNGPTPLSVWLTFDIDFAFKSPLYRQVASLFFEEVAQKMIGAFENRCHTLYGPPSLSKENQGRHQA